MHDAAAPLVGMGARASRRGLSWAAVAAAAVTGSAPAGATIWPGVGVPPGPPDLVGTVTSFSADGRTLAFNYARLIPGTVRNYWVNVGLLDIGSGALRPVPRRDPWFVDRPLFDSASGRLFCMPFQAAEERVAQTIGRVDTETGAIEPLYGKWSPLPDAPIWNIPSFGVAPGGERLLVGRGADPYRPAELVLVDPRRQGRRVIISEGDGAKLYLSIQFVAPEEAWFLAGRQSRGAIYEAISAFGSVSRPEPYLFRVRFGEAPTLLAPELDRKMNPAGIDSGVSDFAVTRDRTAYVISRRGIPGPGYSMQVARADLGAGRLDYLTRSLGLKRGLSVAPDGVRLAFLGNRKLDNSDPYELWTIDTRTGAVTDHEVHPRIRRDPRFLLP